MFVTLWRTISVRVQPDVLLVFNATEEDDRRGGVFSRFRTSWCEDYSLFSWADKGQWETAQTAEGQARRDGNWFRIGFEPVFVDYTKIGTWFLLLQLVEVGRLSFSCVEDGRPCVSCVYNRDPVLPSPMLRPPFKLHLVIRQTPSDTLPCGPSAISSFDRIATAVSSRVPSSLSVRVRGQCGAVRYGAVSTFTW